jgi:hypothetical protein
MAEGGTSTNGSSYDGVDHSRPGSSSAGVRSEEGGKQEELRKVKGHLRNLNAGHVDAGTRGPGVVDRSSSGDSSVNGYSGLGFYDLDTAVRMLTDYINDLRKSNVSPDLSVQTKIQDYETLRDELRDELEEGKQRDLDNSNNGRLLTPQESSKLILMLHDYQAVLQRLAIHEAETLQEKSPDDVS